MKAKLWKKFFIIFGIVCAAMLLIYFISTLVTCKYTSEDLSGVALEHIQEELGVSAQVTDIKELNGTAIVVCTANSDLYGVPFTSSIFTGRYRVGDIIKTDGTANVTSSITADVEYTLSADGTAVLTATESSGRYTVQIIIALLIAVYLAYFWSFGAERRRKHKEFLENSIKAGLK